MKKNKYDQVTIKQVLFEFRKKLKAMLDINQVDKNSFVKLITMLLTEE